MLEIEERLKQKLAQEEASRKKWEAIFLQKTGATLALIPDLEAGLEKAMRAEASFRDLNYGYVGGAGDCAEVKQLMAEVRFAPTDDPIIKRGDGTKLTESAKEAWLTLQRTKNPAIANAIARQKVVAFELENLHISVEMAKRKLDNVRSVLALRTAQANFLGQRSV